MTFGDRTVSAEYVENRPYVIALGGAFSEPTPPGEPHPAGQNGIFVWASGLSSDLYDVHQYSEDAVDEDGEGEVFNNLAAAINSIPGLKIVIAGHSHGGGSVADLCELIESEKPTEQNPTGGRIHHNNFTILLTMYVDAIQQDNWGPNVFAETRYPAGSTYHANIYQTNTGYAGAFINGNAVSGAEFNLDINSQSCVDCVVHTTIDNCQITQDILTDFLEYRVFECPLEYVKDYCVSSPPCAPCDE